MKNYLLNKDRLLGTPGFPEESFPLIEKSIPMYQVYYVAGRRPPGLKIVFASDVLAGAHGRNAEEFIDRVREVEMDPMGVMISATSLAAEALGSRPNRYDWTGVALRDE